MEWWLTLQATPFPAAPHPLASFQLCATLTYASQNCADDAFKWLEGALALDIRCARHAAKEEAFTKLPAGPRFRALILRELGGQPASTQESIHDEHC
ncbi:MAG: hypothetical protein OHK0022_05150 [Roseiflexaceae bacterium]